eukprot:scaffold2047_cov129-Cylindrotheca_fusiformis.AAC.36
MNNAGFADLVRKQSKTSSTKEIARKAVEEEWKRKKKRRRGGGDSSDEESDSDRPRRKKKEVDEEKEEKFEPSADYRDRAKERREGKPGAPREDDDETLQLAQAPAKGLDVSLARKIRQELKSNDNDDLKSDHEQTIVSSLPTLEQATKVMQQFISSDQPGSSTMVEYVQKSLDQMLGIKTKKVNCGVAGKHVQRSRLVLALDGCPSDLKRSWEVPREVTQASSFHDFPRLDLELLEKIDKALPKKRLSRDMKFSKSENEPPGPSSTQGPVKADAEEEDDEDIFGGLDDYVAPIGNENKQ